MGHQLARAAAAAALALTAGCGGGDAAEPPPVIDNARDQIDAVTTTTITVAPGGDTAGAAETTLDAPDELPPPDPSTYEGANRVVNLWVGADGETSPIDVWGRRTFTTGPILLAEDVAFGTASDYFDAPPRYSLVIVNAGAGPDGVERAGLLNARTGEQITTVFTNDDPDGAVYAPNLYERGDPQAPAPPADGTGLVWLAAPNVRSFTDELTEAIGGDAFYVGDGTETCREQRTVADGLAPSILGGTQTVELELAPGPATITLHPWFSPDECAQPSVLDVTVDVAEGRTTLVLVFTRDGATVEQLSLPVAR